VDGSKNIEDESRRFHDFREIAENGQP